MGVILNFTYLYVYIYTLLVIYKPSDSFAAQVSISQNITGLIGNNDTQLTCSFIKEALEKTLSVQFFVKNKTDHFDFKKPIAIFEPDKPSEVLSSGYYLNGRVEMTNITSTSTHATLTFLVLKCEDEKDYMCQFNYANKGHFSEYSESTRISVRASSSKPDSISSILSKTQGYSTSIFNTSLSTKKDDILTTTTSSIDTVTNTHLEVTDDIPLVYSEEDNVTFTCTGDIGNPPGKFIWQKTFPQGKPPIIYSNETTFKEEIPGQCSFTGTSHLTVKIYAEDIKATIRCFEESQVNVPGMYIETEPFDVLYQVNHVHITKHPNEMQYDPRTDNITLTCKGNGNPQPTYVWFKEGQNSSILSNKSFYVIKDVIQNNSGVYICEVYNIIDDTNYRKSNSVEIYIDTLPSSPDSALMKKSFIEIVISVVCVALLIVTCIAVIKYCCFRPKRKDKEESCSRKYSLDGITFSPEYASVILPNSTTAVEKGVAFVGNNGMDDSKSKTQQEDLMKTVDVIPNLQTTSFHTPVYAVPSDALQTQNGPYKIPHGMTSFKDQENI